MEQKKKIKIAIIVLAVLLGLSLERGQGADPVIDSTTMHRRSDRKTLRREQEKKIALGHKEDDHEEEQTWQQTM